MTLNVIAPPPPPVIASLSPNPMPLSAVNQTLTINVSGFVPDQALRVKANLQGAQITSLTATTITVSINVGTAPRTWTIRVINPSGSVSNSATLPV